MRRTIDSTVKFYHCTRCIYISTCTRSGPRSPMLRLIKMTILSSSLLPLSNRNVYSAHSNSSFPPRCLCFRPKFTMRHFIVLFRPLAILVFLGLVWRLYNENSGPDSAGANNLVHHAIHESLRVWKWEILSGHYPSRDCGYLCLISKQRCAFFSWFCPGSATGRRVVRHLTRIFLIIFS